MSEQFRQEANVLLQQCARTNAKSGKFQDTAKDFRG